MLIDARTGEVYETTDVLFAELERRIAAGDRPRCPHGFRVPCTRCHEAAQPPRRRNTWSDEADSTTSAQPPQATPVDGEPQEERDHAGEDEGPDDRPTGPAPELTDEDIPF